MNIVLLVTSNCVDCRGKEVCFLLMLKPECVFVLTGQSGLGKSTLMNTLFKSKVSRKSVLATAQEKIPKTIEIKSISHGMVLWISLMCIPYFLLVDVSMYIHPVV